MVLNGDFDLSSWTCELSCGYYLVDGVQNGWNNWEGSGGIECGIVKFRKWMFSRF